MGSRIKMGNCKLLLTISILTLMTFGSSNITQGGISPNITDTTPPSIDSPADLTYIQGSTGNTIYWAVSEPNPYQYTLYLNGTIYATNSWNGSSLQFNVDGLDIGIYNFTLLVSDTFSNYAYDSVIVGVKGHGVVSTAIAFYSDTELFLSGIPGSGTVTDPYIIEQVYLLSGDNIYIGNTNAYLVIQTVQVDCQGYGINGIDLFSVTNVNITVSNLSGCQAAGINVASSSFVNIVGNSFGSNANGITVWDSHDISIQSNVIEDTSQLAIQVDVSDNITIAANNIQRSSIGSIQLSGTVFAKVLYNTITSAGNDVWGTVSLTNANNSLVESNFVSGGRRANAISLDVAINTTIRSNELTDYDFSAVRVKTSSDTLIESNLIFDMGETGVNMDASQGPPQRTTIQYNDFAGSQKWSSPIVNDGGGTTLHGNYYTNYGLVFTSGGNVRVSDDAPSENANHMSPFQVTSVNGPSVNGGIIQIDWTECVDQTDLFTHAVSYAIYYSIKDHNQWIFIKYEDATTSQWTPPGDLRTDEYQIRVTAIDEHGFTYSAYSVDTFTIAQTTTSIQVSKSEDSSSTPNLPVPFSTLFIPSIFVMSFLRRKYNSNK